MPRLSKDQERARQQIRRLGAGGLPPRQLAERLLAALREAIPADHGGLCTVDPSTLLLNRILAVLPESLALVNAYYDLAYLHDPCAALLPPLQMRAGHPMVVLRQRLDHSLGVPPPLLNAVAEVPTYRAFYAEIVPVGGALRAAFAADGQWVAMLALGRHYTTHAFTPGDLAFLHLVGPTIARALRAALDQERALTVGSTILEASGVLVLGPDGRERIRTPAASVWLDALRQAEMGGNARLPAAVAGALAGLRAGMEGLTHPTVRVATPAGLLRVEASPSSEHGMMVVVMTPEHPAVAPEVPATWPVTGQERRVLELLVAGLNNRQLAAALQVSENTIESHLAHAYEKLGVHSRGQLLARLWRETYRPAGDWLHDSIESPH
jgi:DNA-binding CsgD family transcriptional regulator